MFAILRHLQDHLDLFCLPGSRPHSDNYSCPRWPTRSGLRGGISPAAGRTLSLSNYTTPSSRHTSGPCSDRVGRAPHRPGFGSYRRCRSRIGRRRRRCRRSGCGRRRGGRWRRSNWSSRSGRGRGLQKLRTVNRLPAATRNDFHRDAYPLLTRRPQLG
jgi:hypothetical protein